MSAPIFDHQGALAGAVNITYYGRTSAHAPVSLLITTISDVARQIELDHFHHIFARDRVISVPGEIRSGAILLAVDRDDIIVGASRGARHVFDLTTETLTAGVVAEDLFSKSCDTLCDSEYGVLRRWLVRNGGNVTASARDLGISHATIKRKIRHHRLDRRRLN